MSMRKGGAYSRMCKVTQPPWGGVMWILQRDRHRSTLQYSYTTLGHVLNELQILVQKYHLIHVYCCYAHNSREMRTA